MRKLYLLFILGLAAHGAVAQMAPTPESKIEQEIQNYQEGKSITISKARRMLLDKFTEGDLAKIKEVKDYLVKQEDDTYTALYPGELWLILYWTIIVLSLAGSIAALMVTCITLQLG